MKTVKQVISEHPEYKKLISAVVSNIGKESIEDVVNSPYGMAAGFGNLIYYSDTHKFAMKHRKQINNLLEEEASDFGQEVSEMVAGFGIFKRSPMDKEDRKELYRYLGGGKCEPGTITNIMAWFAAEEVCRWFEE